MGLGQKMGPTQKGEIVDGDDRRDATEERRDKICAVEQVQSMERQLCRQHWLFNAPMHRREQGAPLKIRRVGQWFPLFAVLENCVRCFPIQLRKLVNEILRIATDSCWLVVIQPGVNAYSHGLNDSSVGKVWPARLLVAASQEICAQ